jgi:hypothetical protein
VRRGQIHTEAVEVVVAEIADDLTAVVDRESDAAFRSRRAEIVDDSACVEKRVSWSGIA